MNRVLLSVNLLALGSFALQAQTPLDLSLKQAIDLALKPDRNTRLRIAAESVRTSEARLEQARAAERPVVDGTLREQNQRVNLSAIGLQSVRIPVPGFDFPSGVGPFNTLDARASATYSVVDLSARRRTRASAAGVEAAKAETDTAKEQIATEVAQAYLDALRADTAVEAAQAGVQLANALLQQAQDRDRAGQGVAIDITRARAQIASEQQRLIAAETDRDQQHLQLINAIDLDLDTQVRLTDQLHYLEAPVPVLADALAQARKSRAQFAVFEKRKAGESVTEEAIRSERLPSVTAYADFGELVGGVSHPAATYTAGVALQVPLFDGGRRESRIAESASGARIEQLRAGDLARQIEFEIRHAFASLRTAGLQVKASEEQVALAEEELAQAHRRFDAGLSGSLEVIQAQTRLAQARDNRVEALFRHEKARLQLSQATGTVRDLTL